MKIEVFQTKSVGENEFEIFYEDRKKYIAKLPFVSVNEPLNLEKLRKLNIFNLDNTLEYSSDYDYVKNLKEEFVPFKFLITGSQKFNQLLFRSEQNNIKIYYEENAIWSNRYTIEFNDKKYYCYSIEDGYIRHFPIYDGEIQIGEVLKSNVVIDSRDEYVCYLKDEYMGISDGIVMLILYLDRSEYNSSYVVNKSLTLTKSFSYNKTNKYYNKNWVKDNFDDEFYKKVESAVKITREQFRHPMLVWKKQWNSMTVKEKKMMKFILLMPWVVILVVGVILFLLSL